MATGYRSLFPLAKFQMAPAPSATIRLSKMLVYIRGEIINRFFDGQK
jgi:hypothetical protein